ncbi:Fic family protein [Streptomyces sp. LB8]|uniref:Fic family protein n=1 Tax=Streptomyces sp. LB8 TaxID=3042509 RepID=UPI003464CB42
MAEAGPQPPGCGVPHSSGLCQEGHERYGVCEETLEQFEECLSQATATVTDVPLPARAARAHLDVCFFHPLDDGNGRAALLTMGFILAREKAFLDEVGPVQVRRYADDPVGALSLARLIHILASTAARRGEVFASSRRPGRSVAARLMESRSDTGRRCRIISPIAKAQETTCDAWQAERQRSLWNGRCVS